jgi:hypothetical protein
LLFTPRCTSVIVLGENLGQSDLSRNVALDTTSRRPERRARRTRRASGRQPPRRPGPPGAPSRGTRVPSPGRTRPEPPRNPALAPRCADVTTGPFPVTLPALPAPRTALLPWSGPPHLSLLASRWGTSPIKRQSLPPHARTPWAHASTVRHRAMCAAATEPSLHARPSPANRSEPLPGSPRSSPHHALPRPGTGLAGGRHAASCAAWCRRARAPVQPRPPTLVQIGP